MQKPRVDPGEPVDFLHAPPGEQSVAQAKNPLCRRHPDLLLQGLFVEGPVRTRRRGILAVGPESSPAGLQRAQGFLHRLLEGAPDGHSLPHALHLRRQDGVRLGKLLEGETRHFDHAVVDGRLETGRRFAGDVVAQLVERVADRQFGGDLGDGKSRGLRGERGRAGDARVHLDDHHPAGLRADGKLDIRPSCLHADGADDSERGVAHGLVFFVGQRLDGSDRDRVARVHAHGIEVFNGADHHAVVCMVAHHLDLEFLPSQERFFD